MVGLWLPWLPLAYVRSWRRARRRYRSGCLAVRLRDLKSLRFTINKEFEQNRIPYGQPGFGRWKGPFRSGRIGKKRKPSHIIKWVFSVQLRNASACAWVGSRWRSSSAASYGQRTRLRCQLSPLIAAIQFLLVRFIARQRVGARAWRRDRSQSVARYLSRVQRRFQPHSEDRRQSGSGGRIRIIGHVICVSGNLTKRNEN
jgi:hypothetical protein